MAARLGLECQVFMGEEDIRRQTAECLSDEVAGRRGDLGDLGLTYAQGMR